MSRRQIIIRSTFAKTLDQKFQKGQKVWYSSSYGGIEKPGVIVDTGRENGDVVYDVQLDGSTSVRWGYEDQFSPRGNKDTMGTPADIAFGEGYHSMRSDPNPYTSSEERAAWDRGRAAAKLKEKTTSNYFKGEVRGKRFEPRAPRMNDSKDFNSEAGWIAKIFAPNGKVVTQSEPYIAKGPAEAWLRLQLSKAQNAGLRATGRVFNGFFDPNTLAKA